MKEIRSFFEEPKNYFLGVATGIGSFSGLFFWAVESGLVFYSIASDTLFLLLMILYLGIPSLLPFYDLYISGRNAPVDAWLVILSILSILLFVLIQSYWSFILIVFWICFFIIMFRRGRSIKVSTDTPSMLKENTIFEVILIVFLLLAGGLVVVWGGRRSFSEDPEFDDAFKSFKIGYTLKDEIDRKSDSIYYMRKLLPSEDSVTSRDYGTYLLTYRRYNAIRSRMVHGVTLRELPYMSLSVFNKTVEDIGMLSIAHSLTEADFADKFEKVLKHYQMKGIVLLVISSLMLLILWVILLDKDEVSNRIKAHFVLILFLITPLTKGYDKKDITIRKPFGFKFRSDVNPASKTELDTLLAMQSILIGKLNQLDGVTREIPLSVENRMAEFLTDTMYLDYIESIKDNRDFDDLNSRSNILKELRK